MKNIIFYIKRINKYYLTLILSLMVSIGLLFQNAMQSYAWPAMPMSMWNSNKGEYENPSIKLMMPDTVKAYQEFIANPTDVARDNLDFAFGRESGAVGLKVVKRSGDELIIAAIQNRDGSFKNEFSKQVFEAGIKGIDVKIGGYGSGSAFFVMPPKMTSGLGITEIGGEYTPLSLNNSAPLYDTGLREVPVSGGTLYSNAYVKFSPKVFFEESVALSTLGFSDPRITSVTKHEIEHAFAQKDNIEGNRNFGNIHIRNPTGLASAWGYSRGFWFDEIPRWVTSTKAYVDTLLKYGPNTDPKIIDAAVLHLDNTSKLIASAYNALEGINGSVNVSQGSHGPDNAPNGYNQSSDWSPAAATSKSSGQAAMWGNPDVSATEVDFSISDLSDRSSAAAKSAVDEMRTGARDWLYGADSYLHKSLNSLIDIGAISSQRYNQVIDNMVKVSANNPAVGDTGLSARQLMLAKSNGPFENSPKAFLVNPPNPANSKLFESNYWGVNTAAGESTNLPKVDYGTNNRNYNGYNLNGDSFADSSLQALRRPINDTVDGIYKGYNPSTPNDAKTPGGGGNSNSNTKSNGNGMSNKFEDVAFYTPPKVIDITKPGADTAILNRAMNEAGNIPNISAKTGNQVMYGELNPAPIESVKVSDGKMGIESRVPATDGKTGTDIVKSGILVGLGFAAPAYGNAAVRMENAKTDEERNQILEDFFKSETDLGISMTYFGVGSAGIVAVAGAIGGSAIAGTFGAGLAIAFIPVLISDLSDPHFLEGVKNLLDSPDGAKQIAYISYKITENSLSAATMVHWNRLTLRDILNSMRSGNKDWMRVAKTDPKELARQVNRAIDDALWQNDPNHRGAKRDFGDSESQGSADFAVNPKEPPQPSSMDQNQNNNQNNNPNTDFKNNGSNDTAGSKNTANNGTTPGNGKSKNTNNQQAGNNNNGSNIPSGADPTAGQGNSTNNSSDPNKGIDWTFSTKNPATSNPGGQDDIVDYPFSCKDSVCFVYKPDGSKIADSSGKPIPFALDPAKSAQGIKFPLGMSDYTTKEGLVAVTKPDGTTIFMRVLPLGTINQWSMLAIGKPTYGQNVNAVAGGNSKVPNSNKLGEGTKKTIENSNVNKTGAVTALPKMVYGEKVND